MSFQQLAPAESGWKAVFSEPDGTESISRILAWAIGADKEAEITGVIVDPDDPSRIVAAASATSPGGGTFLRYRYVAPEPIVVTVPPVPTPVSAKDDDSPEQLAKSLLKRRR
jgi:hypothetical protein